ncbi:MAG: hypothetical protein CMG50_03840 [Candidatus Marinimicrobia bacterium]|nr:hypothetical protein [Candidatus Neomarinimicrobiota bacterium]|tara:strand:+ start:17307 stop:17591 length:285 start_codon:yes stop_codon:yes gene_type:complete
MDYESIYKTIISEPIYLSLVIIFLLIIIYSILKKFFKLLMITFISIIVYISFLIYTDGDLPGESEQIIKPMINEAGKALNDLSNQLQEISNSKK